jgi:ubiquinone biosynthesis protein COQ4
MNPLRLEDISWSQRIRMLLGFLGVVRDIERTNDVFKVSEKIPDTALLPAFEQVKKGPWGAAALIERPLVRPNISELLQLPEGTFGREYAELMHRRGLSPDFYPAIEIASAAKYYRVHLYQTHDFWHVVTGFRADPAGELGLQAFYYAQTKMPLPVLLLAAGLLNAALYDPADVTPRLGAIVRGYQMGTNAKLLFGYPWALHWETPLATVRAQLGIVTDGSAMPEAKSAPQLVESYAGAAT